MNSAPVGHELAAFGLPPAPAFALLHRPGTAPGQVEVLTGEPEMISTLTGLPLPPVTGVDGPDVLVVLPYRQIAERGLACNDDGEPLVAIGITGRCVRPVAAALELLPDRLPTLDTGRFDVPDDAYAATVDRVLATNIGRGDGANFVIRRSFRAAFDGWAAADSLALFRRLLLAEQGAYWTFVVHWPGRTLVGATPECHLRLADGVATMNPISGTYRYPPSGPETAGLLRFLGDDKEAGELLMVVDEELKTMARICPEGARVHGPRLRAMSRLAHTEYVLTGRSGLDVREVLRQSIPAPAVTGSPVASACRVIAAHEGSGRGYYSGVLALIGRRVLDSALIIRSADIDAAGRVAVGVGATLVKGSDPGSEAAETRAKAGALISALRGASGGHAHPYDGLPVLGDARVQSALAARNAGLSRFWISRPTLGDPRLRGRSLLLIDAEDDFTAMLARMAESLGLRVRIRRWDDRVTKADIVLIGPGPGDPRDRRDPRIARMHAVVSDLLSTRRPLLAVCLGHQILADELGLGVTRLSEPAQGVRRTVTWNGRPEVVGFYNSFAATSPVDHLLGPLVRGPIRITRDPATGVVHALTGPNLASVQFHLESVLTGRGPAILRGMLGTVLDGSHDHSVMPAVSADRHPTRSVMDIRSAGDRGARMIFRTPGGEIE